MTTVDEDRPTGPGGTATVAAPAGDDPGAAPAGGRRRPGTALVVAGLTAVLALPMVVAVSALRTPRWYPLLDLAQTELRVRDVGTRHTPLIGLIGRMYAYHHEGSHPGPISFYALAPVYRLLGSSAWSLLAGVVVLNTVALGLTMWIAVRRGGAVLALGVGAVVAILLSTYGTHVLTEPWNPYMPVVWWLLALFAVWSVLCDDLAMLPVAVFAGSFCMQTHVSYLGLVGGLAAAGVVGFAVRMVVLRGDPAARRRLVGWSAVSAVLAFVLWLPPLIDQLRNDPGNAALVIHHFRYPASPPAGFGRGGELFAVHLNLWRFLTGDERTTGSVVPALLLVAAWLVSAVVAWRLRPGDDGRAAQRRTLLRLHVLVGAVLALGMLSSVRILGDIWFYLELWAWAITALMLVAIGWTAVLALSAGRARGVVRAAAAGAGVLLVAWTAQFAVGAARAQVAKPEVSAAVSVITPATIAAIDHGDMAGGGRDGRYLVTWSDGTELGAAGWGLLDELERSGFHVGVIPAHGVGAKPHRVMPPGEATAEVHVSVGPDIATWRALPGAKEVVYVDSRTPAERREFARLGARVAAALVATGRPQQAAHVEDGLFAYYLDPKLPESARQDVQRMVDIGSPTAVFVRPAGAAGP